MAASHSKLLVKDRLPFRTESQVGREGRDGRKLITDVSW